MTEQLISFETAKLAKEKGFDLHTIDTFYQWDGSISLCHSQSFRALEVQDKSRPECYAPTQSLLQKWLREEHEIFVQVTWEPIIHYYYCRIDTWNNLPKHVLYFSDGASTPEFYSYEEALEKGLYEALKLIK